MDKMREEFEAKCMELGIRAVRNRTGNHWKDESYDDDSVDGMWMIWQSSWQAALQPKAVTSEDMQDLMEKAFLAGGLPKDLNTLDWRSRLYLVEKAILTQFNVSKKEG